MNFFSIDPAILPTAAFQSINPYTGDLLAEFPILSASDLSKKLKHSKESYVNYWQPLPVEQRLAAIERLALLMEEKREDLARLISLEMGKPIQEALPEIDKCVLLCRYFIKTAPTYLASVPLAEDAYMQYEPIGGILGIMPWNYPFWQVFRFAVPSLIAGNTILLKHAPNVPQCAQQIEQLFDQAIGRSGVFTNLFINVPQVEQVILDEHIQGITLTGSDRAGASVGAIAGSAIKKCILELGGSDAFIVLSDADITVAAEQAARSRARNSGQTCISAKRLIVEASVAPDFIRLLCEQMAALQPGDPLDQHTEISVMARPDLLENLQRQVEESIQMGAEVLLDGGTSEENDLYFAPMVLTNIIPGMPLYEEEVFGPVASVFVVADEEEAIALANDTPYGLGAAVWSTSVERARSVATRLEVGAVAINSALSSRPDVPFGGVKRSGYGKEMGKEGLLEFVNKKTITIGGGK